LRIGFDLLKAEKGEQKT